MKIRTGFVSNSSSSSFCIYGASISDVETLAKALKIESEDDWDAIKSSLEKLGLDWYGNSDYGRYIGRTWSSIKDDETGAQFKKSVDDKLKDLLGELAPRCGTCEEAWYDG